MILPNTSEDGCSHLAEQLRSGIEGLGIRHERSPFGVVTGSFGVASTIPGEEQSPADLVMGADRALYGAKGAGRNCVRSDVEEPEA